MRVLGPHRPPCCRRSSSRRLFFSQVVPSGLSQQLRSVRFFPGGELYAVTGIEGRCGLRCVSVEAEEELNASGKPKNTFTFKCHRVGAAGEKIYAVHGCDTHPTRADVFVTCGADGMFSLWDKEKRVRLREFSLCVALCFPGAVPLCSRDPTSLQLSRCRARAHHTGRLGRRRPPTGAGGGVRLGVRAAGRRRSAQGCHLPDQCRRARQAVAGARAVGLHADDCPHDVTGVNRGLYWHMPQHRDISRYSTVQ